MRLHVAVGIGVVRIVMDVVVRNIPLRAMLHRDPFLWRGEEE